jgi:hypothetical protein
MKPPEKTLPNGEYRKLQREGLEKLIEMEKEKSDQLVSAAVDNGRRSRKQKISSTEPRRQKR